MPPIIGEDNKLITEAVKVVAPVITEPEYRGVSVDTRTVPTLGLTTHVEGSSWTVEYYSQVLDKDSALAGQNVTKNAIYQQYRLIRKMELKVTAPLATNQDTQGGSMVLVGTANVYPFVIPNEGDMFLADIGDGREGIFRITHVDRKSIFKETIHVIEYQLINYSTDELRGDLNMKTIQTLIFVRDFLQYGQNPLLQEEEYLLLDRLQHEYFGILNKYFKSFVSNEYKTLLIPGQSKPVYDHFLTTIVFSFFNLADSPEIRTIRKLNCDGDDVMKVTTIWDALKCRDHKMLKYCIREVGLVSNRTFDKNPMLEGIYYSGINYVVYPKDPELTVDYQIHHIQKILAEQKLQDAPSQIRRLGDLIADNEFQGLTLPGTPAIKKVLVDDYYVLSQAFYDNSQTGKSLLELCVDDYLHHKAPNIKALITLCNTYHAWGALERFYYGIVLLIMVKSAILN